MTQPSPASTIERELKLTVAPGDIDRLRRHPLLKGDRPGRGAQLITQYYDTDDLWFFHHGVSLRLRRSKNKWLMSVKSARSGSSDASPVVSHRPEWEWSVADAQPDLLRIPDLDLGVPMPEGYPATIQLQFSTEIKRTTRLISHGATAIEAALDFGTIVAPFAETGVEEICELELELKGGPIEGLYDLALALLIDVPMLLSASSKADIGFRLVSGASPAVSYDGPVEVLTPATSVGDAFRQTLRSGLTRLVDNQDAALDGADPEGVHQMRVGVRRLRSAFDVFMAVVAPKDADYLGAELKWLQNALGAARDFDVLITETLPLAARKDDRAVKVETILPILVERRQKALQSAVRSIRSSRYTRMLLSLGGWIERSGAASKDTDLKGKKAKAVLLEQPILAVAPDWLDKRLEKVRARAQGLEHLTEKERHALRISVKKLRYTADSFSSLYNERDVKKYLKTLKSLQDLLGHFNDLCIARDILSEIARDAEKLDQRLAAQDLVAWANRRSDRTMEKLVPPWSTFKKAKPFWQ